MRCFSSSLFPLPLLCLTRPAERNREVTGKFYLVMLTVKVNMESDYGLLPHGSKVRDKFLEKAVVGQWLQDVHLEAHVLDTQYWAVDHLSMPEVMGTLAKVTDKIFYTKSLQPRVGTPE